MSNVYGISLAVVTFESVKSPSIIYISCAGAFLSLLEIMFVDHKRPTSFFANFSIEFFTLFIIYSSVCTSVADCSSLEIAHKSACVMIGVPSSALNFVKSVFGVVDSPTH